MMNNPVLDDNLASLPDSLKRLLQTNDFEKQSSVRTILGEKGWPIGVMEINGHQLHTNSRFDPWNEAKRWAETLDYKDVMVSFIYGCGFGYPLLEYARRKKPYTETVIFERDIHVFYAMLSRIDMQALLKDPSIHFVIGDMGQMKELLNKIITPEFLLRATKPAAFFTWLAHRNEKHTYLEIHDWLWNTLELHLSSVGNSVHDTLVGMYNTLDNAESVMESSTLANFKNAFAGKPAIIVSNGPSLDKNVDLLHEAKGKSLILTAESALRPCLQRDIIPDAICVTERTPNVYHIHFENEELPHELVMVGLTLMDPRIPKAFPGPWIPVFRSGESTGKWIQQSICEDELGLNGGGSSAHLAFEFALWVGANPIIFVGQDLAFGPNKQTHSKLSAYSEEYLANQVQLLQAQPSFSVKGIDGNYVATTKIWYEFKTWFEQQIHQHPETRFIDATEGGAYIDGTDLMTLREVIDSFGTASLETNLFTHVQKPQTMLDDTLRSKKYQMLSERAVEIRDKFRELMKKAQEDIHHCKIVEKACALSEKYPGTELPPFVESLFHANTNAFLTYAVDETIVPFTQQLIFAAHKQINDIGEVDTVERVRRVTQVQRQMFEYLQKTCELVAEHFDLAKTRIERNMQMYGERIG
jgi:hypothetical protein